jgi:hypothetical protein
LFDKRDDEEEKRGRRSVKGNTVRKGRIGRRKRR